MTGEDRGKANGGACEGPGGGYTIFLDEERIRQFMAAGDPSSASELEHFRDVGARLEKRIKERSGAVILALSAGEKGISRDFAVLQIAHIIAKHGRNVLIVDGDFLHPGLSGLVENVENHGFLDLLLYGSSLKTVARSVGIEGVSVAGPGSFPVARTIPFAMKEFEKIVAFLRTKHDVVIYCSTLYTEDAKINPLARFVDSALLCCRIDDMSEGELQKNIKALGEEKTPPVELVCFCGKRAPAPAPAPKKAGEPAAAPPPIAAPAETPAAKEEPIAIPMLEKAADLEPLAEEPSPAPKQRISVMRIVSISAAVLILAFVVWWAVISRTVGEKEPAGGAPGREVARAGDERRPSGGADSTTIPVEPAAAALDSPRAAPPSETAQGGAPGTGPAAVETAKPAAAPGLGVYTIHVASFTETFRAENEKKYLEENGFPARIVEVEIKGVRWLRVIVGEFATEDEAAKTRLDLLGLNKVGYARVVTIAAATR
jgi:Mrp family chromosome partitioning ATPase